MMYMPDAIRATLQLMEAPAENINIRSSYNLGGISFSPKEIAAAVAQEVPGFSIDYAPDFRQKIADSWPASIDDTAAQRDWHWQPEWDLNGMVKDMLEKLK
jgi:nucleoside-diphosphate-sugar epimerase